MMLNKWEKCSSRIQDYQDPRNIANSFRESFMHLHIWTTHQKNSFANINNLSYNYKFKLVSTGILTVNQHHQRSTEVSNPFLKWELKISSSFLSLVLSLMINSLDRRTPSMPDSGFRSGEESSGRNSHQLSKWSFTFVPSGQYSWNIMHAECRAILSSSNSSIEVNIDLFETSYLPVTWTYIIQSISTRGGCYHSLRYPLHWSNHW